MNDVPLSGFDPAVQRAMARWPDVPECFDWLSLDRRGTWRIRNEPISHAGAVAFLSRNYACDATGRWFVQNGPQRVFVTLEYTPWILRYQAGAGLSTHTGVGCGQPQRALIDDEGNLLLLTEWGLGLLDDRDMSALSALIAEADAGGLELHWPGRCLPLESIQREAVSRQFQFKPCPQAVRQS